MELSIFYDPDKKLNDRNGPNNGAHLPKYDTTLMTTPITSLMTTYLLAVRDFGEENVYHSLKEHYSDVCSHGDVVINDIINVLYDYRHDSTESMEKALLAVTDAEQFAYHPESTLKWWLEDKKCSPDAWWAS
jgi:hypothetical protein